MRRCFSHVGGDVFAQIRRGVGELEGKGEWGSLECRVDTPAVMVLEHWLEERNYWMYSGNTFIHSYGLWGGGEWQVTKTSKWG